MDFRIKTIALWPKNNEYEVRTIEFEPDKINVITGGNAKGKSTVLYIIDYCLGSSKANIPKEIRKVVDWFGVVFSLTNKKILLARRSPSSDSMNDFYFKIYPKEDEIVLKGLVLETSHNLNDIKIELNSLFELPEVSISDDNFIRKSNPPSFRDLISLNFQPQHIIANPFTLYYKADTTENREKLKSIYPFILGAIDNEILLLREELKELEKRRKRIELLINQKKESVESWLNEVRSYYYLAKELGIIRNDIELEEDTPSRIYLDFLRSINAEDLDFIEIAQGATDEITTRISSLQNRERNASLQLQFDRAKLIELKNLRKSASVNMEATLTEKNRLTEVGWFKKKIESHDDECPLCGSKDLLINSYLQNLDKIKTRVDKVSEINSDSVKLFNQEIQSLQFKISGTEREINQTRYEIRALQDESQSYKDGRLALNNIYRFIGNLELALKNYDSAQQSSELEEELNLIDERIDVIGETYNKQNIQNRIDYAKNKIGELIAAYADILEADSRDLIIRLDDDNLTLKFLDKQGNSDYLWDIGSQHNFLSYHIASLAGIHEYLATEDKVVNVLPTFLIFDQPSQAYFPELDDDNKIREEDINKVKKIFETFSVFLKKTGVQLIVLEHAGENTWKDFDNVVKIKRWRDDEEDDGLVPSDWFNNFP